MERGIHKEISLALFLALAIGSPARADYINPGGYFEEHIFDDSLTHFSARFTGYDFPVNTDGDPDPTPHPGVGGDGFIDIGADGSYWRLTWDIEGFGNDVQVPDPLKPTVDGKEIVPAICLQHVTDPHDTDVQPATAGCFIPYWITNGAAAPGQPIPLFEAIIDAPHPVYHMDIIDLKFYGDADGWNFVNWYVDVEGTHIPEPATMLLLAAVFTFGRSRRR